VAAQILLPLRYLVVDDPNDGTNDGTQGCSAIVTQIAERTGKHDIQEAMDWSLEKR
jgi:hypothetical protein